MRTANPALNSKTFAGLERIPDTAEAMTIQGTVNKTALLTPLVLIAATWTWRLYYDAGNPGAVMPWVFGGAFGGFIVALITILKMVQKGGHQTIWNGMPHLDSWLR